MKLNNRGFAISAILYGLLAVIILLLFLLFQIMRTNSNNTKAISKVINDELYSCKDERINYETCVNDEECRETLEAYKICYCNDIYKSEKLCRQRLFGEE